MNKYFTLIIWLLFFWDPRNIHHLPQAYSSVFFLCFLWTLQWRGHIFITFNMVHSLFWCLRLDFALEQWWLNKDVLIIYCWVTNYPQTEAENSKPLLAKSFYGSVIWVAELGLFGSGFFLRLYSRCWRGPQTWSEDLTEAGRFASKMAHSYSYWEGVSVTC